MSDTRRCGLALLAQRGTITLPVPLLLHRYILKELLRTVLLTTVVLVTVIAFGAAIKPLASGLLTPIDMAKYIVLAVVPMLQFALPFAAGFGATLVFHRLTTDNEILAAAAGGLNYSAILRSVLALGIVLILVMLVLVHSVIPRFWVLLNRTVAEDASRLFITSLERGEAFRMQDMEIYADAFEERTDADGGRQILLAPVAAAELDDRGRIERDVTAERAVVEFVRRSENTWLLISLENVIVFDRADGTLAAAPRMQPDPILLPSTLRSSPKFMTLGALQDLRDDPGNFREIVGPRLDLAATLTMDEVWQKIANRVEAHGELKLSRPDLRLVIEAESFTNGRLRRASGDPVRVTEYRNGAPVRMIEADRATLSAGASGAESIANDLLLECVDTRVIPAEAEAESYRRQHVTFTGISADVTPTNFAEAPLDELVQAARVAAAENPAVERRLIRLEEERQDLDWEIQSRIMQRFALSGTGFLLLLLGSLLAIHLKYSLPLTIYLWAFLPSIANILLISGGDQMMRDGHVIIGTIVMWSGNAAICVMILFVYARVARN